MLAIVALCAICATLWIVPRLLVAGIALLIGVVLVAQARRASRLLLAGRLDVKAGYGCAPSRAQRRLMRRHLRLAISLTELRSLLPSTVARAERCVDRLEGVAHSPALA